QPLRECRLATAAHSWFSRGCGSLAAGAVHFESSRVTAMTIFVPHTAIGPLVRRDGTVRGRARGGLVSQLGAPQALGNAVVVACRLAGRSRPPRSISRGRSYDGAR